MKKITTLMYAAALTAQALAQQPQSRLDSLMNYYDAEYGFNGVAFVSKGGTTLLEKGYGFRDINKGIKNDPGSIFMIGSNTKQFTSEIILQLAMNGKLGLQDKLSQYFPTYPSGEKITIENLLTHTSGIYNYTEDSLWEKAPEKPITKDALLALFINHPLKFEPGEKFEYSNSNYILLGYIIEQLTGKSYQQVVRDNILTPCKMTHSGFDYANLNDPNKATGYNMIQANYEDAAPIADSTLTFAAGSLYSTVEDLYKWHEALQHYTILPKEWQEKAYQPFKKRYGYGWLVDTMKDKRLIGHSGGVPGFYTYEMRIEEEDLDIVLLQNCLHPSMDNNTICINILKCLYDPNYQVPSKRKSVTISADILKQYTGEYSITPDFSITISEKEDTLYAMATGQDEFPVNPMSETKFFSKEVGAEIEFVQVDGKYNKLVLRQGGQKIPAIRK